MTPIESFIIGSLCATSLCYLLYLRDRRIRTRNARRKIHSLMLPLDFQSAVMRKQVKYPRLRKPVVVDCPPKNRDITDRSRFDRHEGDIHFNN